MTIVAEVKRVNERRMQNRKGSILEVVISDGQGDLSLTFFNQAWRVKDLQPGRRGIFAGKVGEYRGAKQLAHPDYELFDDEETARLTAEANANLPIPIYPATSTIASWQFTKIVELVLDGLGPVPDPLPESLRARHGLLDARTAIERIHRPDFEDQIEQARATLRMHEAFVLQVALLQQRAFVRALSATRRSPGAILERFDASLPFARTPDQIAGRRPGRARPRGRLADEPARPGRGRLGQDARRAAGDAPGGRERWPVRADRPDRGARRRSTCAPSPGCWARSSRPSSCPRCSPASSPRPSAARRRCGRHPDRRASSSEPTRC